MFDASAWLSDHHRFLAALPFSAALLADVPWESVYDFRTPETEIKARRALDERFMRIIKLRASHVAKASPPVRRGKLFDVKPVSRSSLSRCDITALVYPDMDSRPFLLLTRFVGPALPLLTARFTRARCRTS